MTLMQTSPLRAALGLLLGASLLFTGCSANTKPQPDVAAADRGTSEVAEQQADQTPEPIDFPADCAAMNPVAAGEAEAFAAQSPGERIFADPDLSGFADFLTPKTMAAINTTTQAQSCGYTVYFQNAVHQWMTEIPEADQQPIRAELEAAGFSKNGYSLYGQGADDYELSIELPDMGGTMEIAHIFTGNLWIVLIGNGQFPRDYAESALKSAIELNPSLAPDSGVDPRDPSECATLTGMEALTKWGPEVPALIDGVAPADYWDLTGEFSDIDGYDPCADLSWIVLRETPCCTRFSPSPILLFHRGEFVQLATERAYALSPGRYGAPSISRTADDTIMVYYIWQSDLEDNAASVQDHAMSIFAWDPGTDSVTRTGDLPPM